MRHFRRIIGVAVVGLALAASQALAQDAGYKIRGETNPRTYVGSSAGSSMRSAREHSTYYRQYAQSAQGKKVDPEVARDAADTIGSYITKARKHFAWMRTQAKASDDKETLASLDVIDKNLAAAAKSHHEMLETCLKADVDTAGSMKCCQQIDEPLAAAIAEHDKLMKRLASEKAPAPKK